MERGCEACEGVTIERRDTPNFGAERRCVGACMCGGPGKGYNCMGGAHKRPDGSILMSRGDLPRLGWCPSSRSTFRLLDGVGQLRYQRDGTWVNKTGLLISSVPRHLPVVGRPVRIDREDRDRVVPTVPAVQMPSVRADRLQGTQPEEIRAV